MNISDLVGFEIVSVTDEQTSFLVCTLRGCDYEEPVEGFPLIVTVELAMQHRIREHR